MWVPPVLPTPGPAAPSLPGVSASAALGEGVFPLRVVRQTARVLRAGTGLYSSDRPRGIAECFVFCFLIKKKKKQYRDHEGVCALIVTGSSFNLDPEGNYRGNEWGFDAL